MSVNQSIASIIENISRPQSQLIEPGLLAAYRMITVAQVMISVVALAIMAIAPDGPDSLEATANIGWIMLLAVYLCWPFLHTKLGRWFLPLALSINSFFPILDRQISLVKYLERPQIDGLSQEEVVLFGWRLVIFLLFPAVIVAWQYGYRGLILFVIATTGLDLLFTGLFINQTGIPFHTGLLLAMARDIFFLLIGYLVAQLLESQHAQQRKLAHANEKLIHYAATVDQLATSRERNRLARELHDTLSHTLSSLSVQLEAADSVWDSAPGQSRTLLVKSITNARSGLAETRRALQDLRASPLEDLGLGLSLRNLAESMSKRAGLNLVLDVPKQVDGLSDEQEQGLYRITQEALENVVKHANAKKLTLTLIKDHAVEKATEKEAGHRTESRTTKNDQDRWVLLIQDDGLGFESKQLSPNGHYGLQGMKERAAMLGAFLQVESQLGQGAEIRLVL